MKYNKTASILGSGGKVVGRMPRDTVKRVHITRAGVKVETRKGNAMAWHLRAPFRIARWCAN